MKQFFSIGLLTIISFATFGQGELYAGFSSSMLRGDSKEVFGNTDLSRRYALQAGILLNIPLNEEWRIKTGVGYSGRGVESRNEHVKLGYAEIPLLISYGTLVVDLYAGPQASFLILRNANDVNKQDLGLVYGVGIGLGVHFYSQVQFYHGFSNVFEHSDSKITNRYISLALGVRLGGYGLF